MYLCGVKTSNKASIMPQISYFYGIYIFMNFNDHNPAHFHAWYGDYKVSVDIMNDVIKGKMPRKELKFIFEWLDLHKEELLINWEKAKKGGKLNTIEPLK